MVLEEGEKKKKAMKERATTTCPIQYACVVSNEEGEKKKKAMKERATTTCPIQYACVVSNVGERWFRDGARPL
jgi:hypothetical protein